MPLSFEVKRFNSKQWREECVLRISTLFRIEDTKPFARGNLDAFENEVTRILEEFYPDKVPT